MWACKTIYGRPLFEPSKQNRVSELRFRVIKLGNGPIFQKLGGPSHWSVWVSLYTLILKGGMEMILEKASGLLRYTFFLFFVILSSKTGFKCARNMGMLE